MKKAKNGPFLKKQLASPDLEILNPFVVCLLVLFVEILRLL